MAWLGWAGLLQAYDYWDMVDGSTTAGSAHETTSTSSSASTATTAEEDTLAFVKMTQGGVCEDEEGQCTVRTRVECEFAAASLGLSDVKATTLTSTLFVGGYVRAGRVSAPVSASACVCVCVCVRARSCARYASVQCVSTV